MSQRSFHCTEDLWSEISNYMSTKDCARAAGTCKESWQAEPGFIGLEEDVTVYPIMVHESCIDVLVQALTAVWAASCDNMERHDSKQFSHAHL